MERLDRDLKSKNFRHLYYLYGSEAYLKLYYKNALIKSIIGDDTMNISVFDQDNASVSEIIGQGQTLPFFSDKRLIVIDGVTFNKDDAEKICEFLEEIPDYLYILFTADEIDKRSKLYKTASAKGAVVSIESFEGDKLKRWAASVLKRGGKKITERDMEYFLSLVGKDMTNIDSELNKLIDYTFGKDIITAGDIDDVTTRQIDDNIFKMIEKMGERRQKEALDYYYDLLALKEPPFKILSLIARQFNHILQAKELLALRETDASIASKLKIPPFAVKKITYQASKYDNKTLMEILEACASTDEDIKSGRIRDRLGVELLIVKYSN